MNIDTVEISAELIHKMKNHAERAYPHECCGILAGKREDDGLVTIKDVIIAGNQIPDKMSGKHFAIDPLEIYGHERDLKNRELEIKGFYHSHPDKPAVLSEEDKKGMIPGQIYLLISVGFSEFGDITAWHKQDETVKAVRIIRTG